MKTKHTPTPWAWQIDHHKDDKGTPPYNVCSIIGNTGDDERRHSTVATTITDDDDAKFITLACNHHEELVAALMAISRGLTNGQKERGQTLQSIAAEALAKLKG